MNAQKFNQRCNVGTVFGLRTSTGLHFVRTVAPAHDIGHGQAMVEINRNPWFVSVKALHSIAPARSWDSWLRSRCILTGAFHFITRNKFKPDLTVI